MTSGVYLHQPENVSHLAHGQPLSMAIDNVTLLAIDSLPLSTGGLASASCVSRPARRSLAFRPAWSLSRPKRILLSRVLSAHGVASMNRSGRYQPERQLLGGARTHQESAPFHGALPTTHSRMSNGHSVPRLAYLADRSNNAARCHGLAVGIGAYLQCRRAYRHVCLHMPFNV